MIGEVLTRSVLGAGGALAVDAAFSYDRLPAVVRSGPVRPVAKVGGALLLGMLVRQLATAAVAKKVAAGAATVAIYEAAKPLLKQVGLPLAGYHDQMPELEFYNPGARMGAMLPASSSVEMAGIMPTARRGRRRRRA